MRKGWAHKYKGLDINELQNQAKAFFILKEGKKNCTYIGPKEEYQMWYNLFKREKNLLRKKKWRDENLEYDKKRSEKKGRIGRFKTKVLSLQRIANTSVPKCTKCGCSDIRILTINHINRGGRKEAEELGGSDKLYKMVLHGERTVEDLEVRCFNCNILYEYETNNRILPDNWEDLQKALIDEWQSPDSNGQ